MIKLNANNKNNKKNPKLTIKKLWQNIILFITTTIDYSKIKYFNKQILTKQINYFSILKIFLKKNLILNKTRYIFITVIL